MEGGEGGGKRERERDTSDILKVGGKFFFSCLNEALELMQNLRCLKKFGGAQDDDQSCTHTPVGVVPRNFIMQRTNSTVLREH